MTETDFSGLQRVLERIADALELSAGNSRNFQGDPATGGKAFIWTPDRGFKPVPLRTNVKPGLLVGVEEQQESFYENFRRFVSGRPSLDVLLWGERGAGKTSLVASLFEVFPETGWALVNVGAPHINALWDLLERLSADPRRWLIFLDDLNFTQAEEESRDLKIFLEGGISRRPENTLVVATSNRRHLLPEHFPDPGAIHPDEDVAEAISLADRFGLSLGFSPMDQDTYLLAVAAQLGALKIRAKADKWREEAIRFAMERGLRSGRTAAHFARLYAGSKAT